MPDYTSYKKLYIPNRKDTVEVDTSLAENFKIIDKELMELNDQIENESADIDGGEFV